MHPRHDACQRRGWLPGQTYAVALCGDNFFDDLVGNAETRATYLNQQEARELRSAVGRPLARLTTGAFSSSTTVALDDELHRACAYGQVPLLPG